VSKAVCRSLFAFACLTVALAAAAPASAAPVLGQDFEGGLGSWTADGFWHAQTDPQNVEVKAPEINPGMVTIPSGTLPPAFSGNHVAWFGEASTGTFCGPGWSVSQAPKSGCTSSALSYAGHLTSPSFSLTGAISAILRFRSWWEIEGVAANAYDTMQVEYSTNGGSTWIATGKLNPANNPAGDHHEGYSNNGLLAEPGWKNYIVDLSAAIGAPSVQIRFAFDTRDNLYNGFRGWLVDDVSVSTPFDAGAPVVTDVNTCSGLTSAPIWVAHGSNYVQGSKVYIDGAENLAATMPAPDRIELQAGNAGLHTIRVVSPNGTASNTLQFAAGNCADQGGPSGAGKRPSQIQVFCNYIVASETDTCTATVADATGGGRIPTGTVKFSTGNGGAFLYGDTCTLKKTELSTVSNCTIEGFKPPQGKPLSVSGSYSGDSGLQPSGGATQFLMAAPGNGAYLQTIKPFQGFGAPNGPQTPSVTVTIDNPVGGTEVDGEASLSTNGSVCSSGMGGAGASTALSSATSLLPQTSIVAVTAAKKGKAKGKGRKRVTAPGLKYKQAKVRRINAIVVSKTKRKAKAGKVKLQLKFNKRKLKKMFGKKKRLTLVVRVTLDFKKGQPAVIYRAVKLKQVKGKFKVVKQKSSGKAKGKGKKATTIASLGRPLAQPAQAGATHRWVGGNDCNQLTIGAQFDQGANQAPFVGFHWQGQMVCLDGSVVPFNYAPPSGMRGTIASGDSVTFSFAEFTNPGYTLSGTLFSGSAAASGRIGGQFPDGSSCQAIAPTVLTQTQ
jgi:hypothetical protein